MSLLGRGEIINQTRVTLGNLTMCEWTFKESKRHPGFITHSCALFCFFHMMVIYNLEFSKEPQRMHKVDKDFFGNGHMF